MDAEPTCGRGDTSDHEAAIRAARTHVLALAVARELRRLGATVLQDTQPKPFAVVALDDRLVAGNRPLFELLGCHRPDLLGSVWSSVMPAWTERGSAREFRADVRPPRHGADDRAITAHVSVVPVLAAGGEVVAHTVLLSTALERTLAADREPERVCPVVSPRSRARRGRTARPGTTRCAPSPRRPRRRLGRSTRAHRFRSEREYRPCGPRQRHASAHCGAQ